MLPKNQPLPSVLILAAGRGTRMRPLTDTTPKALLPVGSKTLIEHHLERLAAQGFAEVVINLAWLGAQIAEYLSDDARRFGLEVRYSDETDGALETGGGIVKALALLRGDPFMVINADVLCDFNYAALKVPDACDLQLVLAPTPPYRQQGDFALQDGRLQVREDANDWTYAGIGCFRRRAFDGFSGGQFPLLPVIEQAIAGGRAGGVVHHGLWRDVGTPERLEQARQLVL